MKKILAAVSIVWLSMFVVSCCKKEIPIGAFKVKWKKVELKDSAIMSYEVPLGFESKKMGVGNGIDVEIYFGRILGDRLVNLAITTQKVSKERLDNFPAEQIIDESFTEFNRLMKTWEKKKIKLGNSINGYQFYTNTKSRYGLNQIFLAGDKVHVITFATNSGEIGNLSEVAQYFMESFRYSL